MTVLRKIRKALGALLGAATGVAIVQLFGMFGVTVDPALADALAIVLAFVGAWLAPRNETA